MLFTRGSAGYAFFTSAAGVGTLVVYAATKVFFTVATYLAVIGWKLEGSHAVLGMVLLCPKCVTTCIATHIGTTCIGTYIGTPAGTHYVATSVGAYIGTHNNTCRATDCLAFFRWCFTAA